MLDLSPGLWSRLLVLCALVVFCMLEWWGRVSREDSFLFTKFTRESGPPFALRPAHLQWAIPPTSSPHHPLSLVHHSIPKGHSPRDCQQIILVNTRRPSLIGSRVLRVITVSALVEQDFGVIVRLGIVSSWSERVATRARSQSRLPRLLPSHSLARGTYSWIKQVVTARQLLLHDQNSPLAAEFQ